MEPRGPKTVPGVPEKRESEAVWKLYLGYTLNRSQAFDGGRFATKLTEAQTSNRTVTVTMTYKGNQWCATSVV